MSHSEAVEKYMNQYPVLFLSLKEVFGTDFNAIFRNFQNIISTLCKNNVYLLNSKSVDKADTILFEKLRYRECNQEDTVEALNLLSRMLHAFYNKPVFIIIDEYDVPMVKALNTPAYDQTRDMIEHMLSYVCKTNENVKAVILSGCLYTVKNSTYTGVNNNPLYCSKSELCFLYWVHR
ncbi:MAG: AAA family ATPase [Synergistaceae bacterium]|nr:AAA family ATPase [Synergistaceae bacterium]